MVILGLGALGSASFFFPTPRIRLSLLLPKLGYLFFPHCFFLLISDYIVSLMLVLLSFFEDDVIQKHILFF